MPAPAQTVPSRRSLGALLLVALLAVTFTAVAPRSASAATITPVAVSATSPSTSSLKVDWSAPEGAGTEGWSVHLEDTAGRTWPGTAACKACRSIELDGLMAGMRYEVQVVGYGMPMALGSTVATVQAGTCAGVSGTCVTVGAAAKGAATNVAQGFLHGTTAKTNTSKVAALQPASWRIAAGDFTRFARAREIGGDITVLLSDPWRGWADRHGLVGQNPWADWEQYRTYIAGTVQLHVKAGMVPEHWEIQNEPDWVNQYTSNQPATRDRILEQLRVAHDAIRSVLPDARIVGPSLSQYRFSEPARPIDLRSFLDFVKLHGLRMDVSWHELGHSQPATPAGDPSGVISRVQSVRAAIADRDLQDVRIHVNEYGAKWSFDQPGTHVGYIEALETAGVDVASMACWPVVHLGASYGTCFADPGLLDGLLSPLGLETDTYAVHEAYAAMDGTRLQTGTTDPWSSAYSVRSADGTVRTLIGRHQSCTVGIDEGCHTGIAAAPVGKQVTVALAVPCKGTYVLQVRLIANVHNAVPSIPATIVYRSMTCGAGKVALPALTDGSAYDVIAQPR